MTPQQVSQIRENKALPHPTKGIAFIETHISWVLLADRYAYKIKKPLAYSFLDFSTLEKRERYCRQEVVLNRRLAPGMYLGVLPVCEKEGRYSIGNGAGGRVVDYAVWMQRMDEQRQMDLLLEQGGVSPEETRVLADILAGFHKKARKVRQAETWLELYEEFEDLSSVRDCLERHFGKETGRLISEINAWVRPFLEQMGPRIEARKTGDFVVEGHGDLHCRNIFMLDPPVIFDCIEFNEALRTLDVLSEVGFLCMDLERFGRADLAEAFMERYQALTGCIRDGLDRRLFLFYKLYRANVRIKVHALQMQGEPVSGADQALERERAGQYLSVFRRYYDALRAESGTA